MAVGPRDRGGPGGGHRVHRPRRRLLGGAEIAWNDDALDDDCRFWARVAADTASPHASAGRYVNDVAEVGREVVRGIYGDTKYERLVALKREWDPDNVFRLNQNIKP